MFQHFRVHHVNFLFALDFIDSRNQIVDFSVDFDSDRRNIIDETAEFFDIVFFQSIPENINPFLQAPDMDDVFLGGWSEQCLEEPQAGFVAVLADHVEISAIVVVN